MKKFNALLISICLLLSDSSVLAAPNTTASPQVKQGDRAKDLSPKKTQIAIPQELGSIEETYSASKGTGKTIIYIQDAHDSLEAQENIAKIIHHLVKEHGVKTVLEEGYEGPVPTDEYFDFIEDPEVKEKVAFFLLDKLRLGGAEYAHINRKEDFELIGVDSEKMHKENIEAYKEAAKLQKSIGKDLKAIEKHIKKLTNRYFPKELKQWIKIKERLDDQKIELLDYLRRVVKSVKDTRPLDDQDLSAKYPSVDLIITSGNSKDPETVEKLKTIEAKTLFAEIKALEEELSGALLAEDRDKQIFEYYRIIQLLKRLNMIELSSEEYEVVKTSLKDLDTQKLAEFIVKHSGKSLVLSKRWERNIKHAMRFYDTAHARDEVMEKKLDANVKDKAVLVFGGFHKDKIKEILKRKGYSYYIITPKITEISKKHQKYYKRLMSVGYHPEELPAAVNKGVAQSKAFHETTRTNFPNWLLASSKGTELHTALSELRMDGVNLDSPDVAVMHAGQPFRISNLTTEPHEFTIIKSGRAGTGLVHEIDIEPRQALETEAQKMAYFRSIVELRRRYFRRLNDQDDAPPYVLLFAYDEHRAIAQELLRQKAKAYYQETDKEVKNGKSLARLILIEDDIEFLIGYLLQANMADRGKFGVKDRIFEWPLFIDEEGRIYIEKQYKFNGSYHESKNDFRRELLIQHLFADHVNLANIFPLGPDYRAGFLSELVLYETKEDLVVKDPVVARSKKIVIDVFLRIFDPLLENRVYVEGVPVFFDQEGAVRMPPKLISREALFNQTYYDHARKRTNRHSRGDFSAENYNLEVIREMIAVISKFSESQLHEAIRKAGFPEVRLQGPMTENEPSIKDVLEFLKSTQLLDLDVHNNLKRLTGEQLRFSEMRSASTALLVGLIDEHWSGDPVALVELISAGLEAPSEIVSRAVEDGYLRPFGRMEQNAGGQLANLYLPTELGKKAGERELALYEPWERPMLFSFNKRTKPGRPYNIPIQKRFEDMEEKIKQSPEAQRTVGLVAHLLGVHPADLEEFLRGEESLKERLKTKDGLEFVLGDESQDGILFKNIKHSLVLDTYWPQLESGMSVENLQSETAILITFLDNEEIHHAAITVQQYLLAFTSGRGEFFEGGFAKLFKGLYDAEYLDRVRVHSQRGTHYRITAKGLEMARQLKQAKSELRETVVLETSEPDATIDVVAQGVKSRRVESRGFSGTLVEIISHDDIVQLEFRLDNGDVLSVFPGGEVVTLNHRTSLLPSREAIENSLFLNKPVKGYDGWELEGSLDRFPPQASRPQIHERYLKALFNIPRVAEVLLENEHWEQTRLAYMFYKDALAGSGDVEEEGDWELARSQIVIEGMDDEYQEVVLREKALTAFNIILAAISDEEFTEDEVGFNTYAMGISTLLTYGFFSEEGLPEIRLFVEDFDGAFDRGTQVDVRHLVPGETKWYDGEERAIQIRGRLQDLLNIDVEFLIEVLLVAGAGSSDAAWEVSGREHKMKAFEPYEMNFEHDGWWYEYDVSENHLRDLREHIVSHWELDWDSGERFTEWARLYALRNDLQVRAAEISLRFFTYRKEHPEVSSNSQHLQLGSHIVLFEKEVRELKESIVNAHILDDDEFNEQVKSLDTALENLFSRAQQLEELLETMIHKKPSGKNKKKAKAKKKKTKFKRVVRDDLGYYATLGVERDATDKEIGDAYRKLALRYHPDTLRGKSEEEISQSNEKFKRAAEAHEVLSDAEKRAYYDRHGQAPRSELRNISVDSLVVIVDGAQGISEGALAEKLVVHSQARTEVVVYNAGQMANSETRKVLKENGVKLVEGDLATAIAPFEYRINVGLMHSSAKRSELRIPEWAVGRFEQVVGQEGSAALGAKYFQAIALKKPVEGIRYENRINIVSPLAASEMRALLQAQFVVAFARSA